MTTLGSGAKLSPAARRVTIPVGLSLLLLGGCLLLTGGLYYLYAAELPLPPAGSWLDAAHVYVGLFSIPYVVVKMTAGWRVLRGASWQQRHEPLDQLLAVALILLIGGLYLSGLALWLRVTPGGRLWYQQFHLLTTVWSVPVVSVHLARYLPASWQALRAGRLLRRLRWSRLAGGPRDRLGAAALLAIAVALLVRGLSLSPHIAWSELTWAHESLAWQPGPTLGSAVYDLATWRGQLWAAAPSGLWRLGAGGRWLRAYGAAPVNGLSVVDGQLWLATGAGLRRWDDSGRLLPPELCLATSLASSCTGARPAWSVVATADGAAVAWGDGTIDLLQTGSDRGGLCACPMSASSQTSHLSNPVVGLVPPPPELTLRLAWGPAAQPRLWAATVGGLFSWENGAWLRARAPLDRGVVHWARTLPDGALWVASASAGVRRSFDGHSWLGGGIGLPEHSSQGGTHVGHVIALASNPAEGSNLVAGTIGKGVFESLDGGASWHPLRRDLPQGAYALVPSLAVTVTEGQRTVWAGVGGRLYRLTTAGAAPRPTPAPVEAGVELALAGALLLWLGLEPAPTV